MTVERQPRTKTRRTEDASSRRGIQSIEVGLRIIEALTAVVGPQTLKTLSEVSGISPSHCHRYLASFVRTGFVTQNATGRYDFGPLAVRAGLAALGRLDPVATGLAALSRLVEDTGHTGLLAVLGEHGAVIIRWVTGRQPVRTSLSIGSTLPILNSATGRVFLAFLPPEETAGLVAREAKGSKKEVIAGLRAKVRKAGIARVSGILVPGLSAAAAPILDSSGNAAAVLTLVGFRDGFGRQSIARLREIASETSRDLGFCSQ
jgi:DNA-binding IclR family transcriptional regulator